jgi:hypothetical protein
MTWNGPAIGIMRPGMLAVSGCRPPYAHDNEENWVVYRAIITDVEQYVSTNPSLRIAHGGADGVDVRAGATSVLPRERYLPNYQRDGDAAPLIRNAYVTTTERFCAWPAPWSRGTWDAVKKRLKACGASGFEMRIVQETERIIPPDVMRLIVDARANWTIVGRFGVDPIVGP